MVTRHNTPACEFLLRAAIYLANSYPPALTAVIGGGQAYARPVEIEDALSLLYALRCIVSFDLVESDGTDA